MIRNLGRGWVNTGCLQGGHSVPRAFTIFLSHDICKVLVFTLFLSGFIFFGSFLAIHVIGDCHVYLYSMNILILRPNKNFT